jgi:peptidyl-prolyl cis-trans isomerase C
MIAKVNGTTITVSDLEKEVKGMLAQYHQQQVPLEQIQPMLPQIKKQAIESLINRQLLYEEVDRRNIVSDSDQVKAEIKKIASSYPSQAEFEKQLNENGFSVDQMEKDMEQQLKLDLLIKEDLKFKDIQVTEEEASSFFKSNPDSFQAPIQVRASHILLKASPEDPQDVKTQKRLELAGILGRIEKGADFADMARNHSDCPSKEQGGDLGLFGKGAMIKPFEDAAFSMNLGEVSDIVETEFGFHIIRLEERNEERKEEFDAVKEEIINHLAATKEQAKFDEFIKDLRNEAAIEYAEEA